MKTTILSTICSEDLDTLERAGAVRGFSGLFVDADGTIVEERFTEFKADARHVSVSVLYRGIAEVRTLDSRYPLRQHLTPHQRALAAAGLVRHEMQVRGLSGLMDAKVVKLVAEVLGISESPIARADYVLQYGCHELRASVGRGRRSTSDALSIAQQPTEKQATLVGKYGHELHKAFAAAEMVHGNQCDATYPWHSLVQGLREWRDIRRIEGGR